ncbi:glycosyltransferase [Oenococcus oeni]|nr:hypothetical protein ATX08_10055 [Oenococcus oeni]OLQ35073.1 hypothetical protein ATX09_07445 [Oenococcus oeni]
MEKIAVLVTVYNGGQFLSDQLKSILLQNYDHDKYLMDIYIYDDGSHDNSIDILHKFLHQYRNVHLVKPDDHFRGVKHAIYTLLKRVDADYYYFADQDDIWKEDKITKMQHVFQRYSGGVVGVYSNLELVDKEGSSLNKTMISVNHWDENEVRDFGFLLFHPRVTGAAFSINRTARNIVLQIPMDIFLTATMHDALIALVIELTGNLVYLSDSLLLYRQHGNNQVGASQSLVSYLHIKQKRSMLNGRFNDVVIISKYIPQQKVKNKVEKEQIKTVIEFYEMRDPIHRIMNVKNNWKTLWKKVGIFRTTLNILLNISRKGNE